MKRERERGGRKQASVCWPALQMSCHWTARPGRVGARIQGLQHGNGNKSTQSIFHCFHGAFAGSCIGSRTTRTRTNPGKIILRTFPGENESWRTHLPDLPGLRSIQGISHLHLQGSGSRVQGPLCAPWVMACTVSPLMLALLAHTALVVQRFVVLCALLSSCLSTSQGEMILVGKD